MPDYNSKDFIHNDKWLLNEPKWSEVEKDKLPPIAYATVSEWKDHYTGKMVCDYRMPHHWVRGGTEILDSKGHYCDGDLYLHRTGLIVSWANLLTMLRSDVYVPNEMLMHINEHRLTLLADDPEYRKFESDMLTNMGIDATIVTEVEETITKLSGGHAVAVAVGKRVGHAKTIFDPAKRQMGSVAKALVHNNTVDAAEPSWGDVVKTELPALAFAYVEDKDKVSTWKLPHHWVESGSDADDKGRFTDGDMYLHRGGVAAAWAAIQGARSGQPMDIPQDAIDHIQAHREALGMADKSYIEFEKQALKNAGLTDAQIEDVHKSHPISTQSVSKDAQPFNLSIPLVKADTMSRIVYGVVYRPDEIDLQGHFMTAEEVEKMAHQFMVNVQLAQAGIDYMHNSVNGSGMIVESFLAREDNNEEGKLLWKKGDWVLGVKVVDMDLWTKIAAGKIRAFSLAGHAEFGKTVNGKPGDVLPVTGGLPGKIY